MSDESQSSAALSEEEMQKVSRAMISRTQGELKALIESVREKGSPQMVELLNIFQSELNTVSTRAIADFASLPTVQQSMARWLDAGLPKDDIMFLQIDVAALLDMRMRYAHEDMAKMMGLTGGAIFAVAQVFAAAMDEAMKARGQIADLRKEVKELLAAEKTRRASDVKMIEIMGQMNQSNYDLAQVMGTNWKQARMYLIAGSLASGALICAVSALIGYFIGRP